MILRLAIVQADDILEQTQPFVAELLYWKDGILNSSVNLLHITKQSSLSSSLTAERIQGAVMASKLDFCSEHLSLLISERRGGFSSSGSSFELNL